MRTEVTLELFREEVHRDPADARELAGTIARHSRARTSAVAGFDLTFSPVKSVSTLWAVADRPVAAAIEAVGAWDVSHSVALARDHRRRPRARPHRRHRLADLAIGHSLRPPHALPEPSPISPCPNGLRPSVPGPASRP